MPESSLSIDYLLERYPDLKDCETEIRQAAGLIIESYRQGGKVLICGNGGSAADSEHIVGELMKGFLLPRPISKEDRRLIEQAAPEDADYLADHLQGALPAISLVSQVALTTAFANDVAPDMIFAQQVYGYGRAGDVLIAISTSGNSTNIFYSAEVAHACGLKVLSFTGVGGGRLKEVSDVNVAVPAEMTHEAQERHLAIYHVMCSLVEEAFFGGNSGRS